MGANTRQAALERRSLAREEATRARSDVRALAEHLHAILHEQEPGKRGARPLLLAWIAEVGPEALAAIAWRRVLARLDSFRVGADTAPYVTGIEAARLVCEGVRLELTARAVEQATKGQKKRGDPRWTGIGASRLGVRVGRDAKDLKRAVRLVGLLVDHSDLLDIERRRSNCIVLTDKGRAVMEQYWQDAWPVRGPMLVQPASWRSGRRGGYTAEMAGVFPLIRKSRDDDPGVPLVRRALDTLQDTAWRVDQAVFQYAQSSKSEKRADRTLRIAEQLLGDPIYFPHDCDWRGRVYPMPDFLSIDSDDLARGLLKFAEPKPLGDDGEKWLAVHGANKYGLRGTFDARWKWVRENSAAIVAAAEDPEDSEILGDAGEHYQFYAFVCEWKAYMDSGQGSAFPSSLPCEQDASCNAIQHLAALWRDAGLGEKVNLRPTTEPQDVYAEIEREVRDWFATAEIDLPMFEWWRHGKFWRLSRALVKAPVMTLGYGVTRRRVREQIVEAIEKSAKNLGLPSIDGSWVPAGDAVDEFLVTYEGLPTVYEATEWLTKVLWDEILPKYAPQLRRARDWFEATGRTIAATNWPVTWTVPVTGLRVRQDGWKYWKPNEGKRINAKLGGALGTPIFYLQTDDVDRGQQSRALAANVVHSLDAAALVLTINRLAEVRVTAVATVHDGYWVRAADGEALARAGREGFHELHREDVLANLAQQFQIQAAEVPNPSEYLRRGTLEIEDVLKALYFMS